MESRMYERIHEGMDVCDRDGDKIGKAGETLGQFFNVDAGFLGTKEYYVPFSAITEVVDNAVYLNVDKDDLERMGWDQRPDERTRAAGATETEGQTLRLREEELQARKSSVEAGSVHLGKEVVEEQRTLDVPVTREEVTIERHPIDRRLSDQPIDNTERETVRVPVREEQVEVEKKPFVYEEVEVGKRVTRETQQVSDTVRREELRVDNEGDTEARTDPNS
ncbi:MAG: YsnF/AvaK domain-containing protein [Chloroflexi bacterium]|nr:YsnF/AvaK domain-containing protein [Chloroflexota bacterium]